MKRCVVLLALLGVAAGCSDGGSEADGGEAGSSGASGVGGAAGGTGNAGSSTGGSAAGAGGPGSTAGAGAGPTGGGSSGTGGAGTGAVGPLDLEPLALGNTWTYTLNVPASSAGCQSGPGTREVVASVQHEGRAAFEVRRFCDPDPSYMSVSDGEVWQYLGGWYRNVAAPVEDGYSWAFAPGFTLLWSAAGSVTVPAGTFQNCWQRSIMEFEGSVTFCPGVGQVRINLPNVSAELSGYELN